MLGLSHEAKARGAAPLQVMRNGYDEHRVIQAMEMTIMVKGSRGIAWHGSPPHTTMLLFIFVLMLPCVDRNTMIG